ncbi:MAG TPA: protein translocase subunit SecF [Candidatus Paceibacterota bacterium]|nr:protein translocase subunit SecF [Candidatus Paceibacterota bacterium]
MLNITGHRKVWFTISGILVGLALVAIGVYRFQESAEFKGGTLWEFSAVADNPSLADVQDFFVDNLKLADAQVSYDSQHQTFLATFGTLDEAAHQQDLSALKAKWPSFTELSFQSISPSVGASLRTASLIALALVILGISLYIAFAFRKASRPVSSWKYGWITLLTLFHDVSIPAGLLAILGRFASVQINSDFIVALLVVMGFSVHDTIVVFDRIRENLLLQRGKEPFEKIVNDSVNQTMARSINTSLTLILVLLALFFIGPVDLKYFVLTLLVGVTTGIYSSIFIASPLLLVVSGEGKRQ